LHPSHSKTGAVAVAAKGEGKCEGKCEGKGKGKGKGNASPYAKQMVAKKSPDFNAGIAIMLCFMTLLFYVICKDIILCFICFDCFDCFDYCIKMHQKNT
jgi:hypothetical protein